MPTTGLIDWSEGGGGTGIEPTVQDGVERGVLPSETEFLNGALAEIGASLITGVDDGSVNADYCRIFYPPLLRAVLRMDHWNFATGRASLQLMTAPIPFGYNYKFQLPADWIKTREFNGFKIGTIEGQVEWEGLVHNMYAIEGRGLITNYSTAYLTYTKLVTDPAQWDPLFYQAMQSWLASKLAKAIPKDHKKANDLLNTVLQVLMPLATATNGQERTNGPIPVNDLTRGR